MPHCHWNNWRQTWKCWLNRWRVKCATFFCLAMQGKFELKCPADGNCKILSQMPERLQPSSTNNSHPSPNTHHQELPHCCWNNWRQTWKCWLNRWRVKNILAVVMPCYAKVSTVLFCLIDKIATACGVFRLPFTWLEWKKSSELPVRCGRIRECKPEQKKPDMWRPGDNVIIVVVSLWAIWLTS